jgi:predicted  nucleic acid-binding Zn-ribbon protein
VSERTAGGSGRAGADSYRDAGGSTGVYPAGYALFVAGDAPFRRGSSLLEVLDLLRALSRIDTEIQELEAENERLPEEIEELEAERRRMRADLEAAEGELESLSKDRKLMERELEDLQAKLADLTAKRLAIKTNEEYAALSHEITFVEREIEVKEDAILGILERQEAVAATIAEFREGVSESEREIDRGVEALQAELSRLDDALAVKRDERLRVATRIDDSVLERYERILASKGDTALANVSDGACSGCYMTLPPQTVIEVKRADRLMECQSCGRILFWRPEPDGG